VRSNANAVVLTDPSPRAEGVAPLVSVGVSHAHVQIGDVAAFARERLEESATLEEIEILRESPRSLDGMPGHEIHARARETGSEREVVVTQLLATDGARYFLVQAIVDARERDDFAPWVDALVASFRRVSNP
jgi:hypothetical protein